MRLGVPDDRAPLHFGRADGKRPKDPDAGPAPFAARYLFMSGKPAFELSLWCGTCPFLFRRKAGANGTLSSDAQRLTLLEESLSSIDPNALDTFSPLLPEGEFLPLLLEVRPVLVAPNDDRDYFTHEQVATWGVDSFWGLPESPRGFYYRTFETRVKADEHLYEFVVPMVPPGWNDASRVTEYERSMAEGRVPTAVALSTLDVCQPAIDDDSTDYYVHWGLTHFLLDGHHKFEAAARSGAPVRLLALLSLNGSLAGLDDVHRLPDLLKQQHEGRKAVPSTNGREFAVADQSTECGRTGGRKEPAYRYSGATTR